MRICTYVCMYVYMYEMLFINAFSMQTQYHPYPYHNCMHAADVMQTVHTLLNLATFEVSIECT